MKAIIHRKHTATLIGRFPLVINCSFKNGFPFIFKFAKRIRSTQKQLRAIQGQSLFEVVFTVAIVAIILTGVASVAVVSVRNAGFSNKNAQATRYAQEATEWLRAERDNGWSAFLTNISNSSSFTYCLDDLHWSNPDSCSTTQTIGSTIFVRNVSFTCYSFTPPDIFPTADCTETDVVANVQADISVSWVDAQGTHTVQNAARYTNWRE